MAEIEKRKIRRKEREREREIEKMRNRVSQTMKREEDREARNVFHGRLMDGRIGSSRKKDARPYFFLLDLFGGTASRQTLSAFF